MQNLIYDAMRSLFRGRMNPSTGEHSLNCPACIHNGTTQDRRKRGSFKLEPDNTVVYNCFNCQFATRYKPGDPMWPKVAKLLGWMGMSSGDLQKLSFAVNQLRYQTQQGRPPITKQPLPAGARTIGQWIEDSTLDPNFLAVAADVMNLGDVDPETGAPMEPIRDYQDHYWTPDPGAQGDLNRCFIVAIGPKDNPDGWIAQSVDDPEREPYLSDPNILFSSVDDGD